MDFNIDFETRHAFFYGIVMGMRDSDGNRYLGNIVDESLNKGRRGAGGHYKSPKKGVWGGPHEKEIKRSKRLGIIFQNIYFLR